MTIRNTTLTLWLATVMLLLWGADSHAGFIAAPYTKYVGGQNMRASCNAMFSMDTSPTSRDDRYDCQKQTGTDSDGNPIMENVTKGCGDIHYARCSSNKCDEDWKANGCYNTQQLHEVTWYKACPKGRSFQDPASAHVSVFAYYEGHGETYEPGKYNYDTKNATKPAMLVCSQVGRVPDDDGGLQVELTSDLAFSPGGERDYYPLMGCSDLPDGRWHPGYGVRDVGSMQPDFPNPKVPNSSGPTPVPESCRGGVNFSAPGITKFVCYPEGCNMQTLEGCDMPQGYYHFYAIVHSLHPEINDVGPGPTVCEYPAFETTDNRYCGGNCKNGDGTCKHDTNGDGFGQEGYYTGINKDQTPVPGQQFYFSAFSVGGMKQPTYVIKSDGTTEYNEAAVKVNSFNPSNGPAARIPSEVPAGMGVWTVEGAGNHVVDLGLTPLQVRSMECTKQADGYLPIQNISLGQTKRMSMKQFVGDKEPILPLTEKLTEMGSCDLVEEISEELPSYNILPQGQTNFGMAHSVSTAVNQLLQNRKTNDVPILTVALSEPVRDCIESSGKATTPPEKPNETPTQWETDPKHSYFRGSETKWGSHDNASGTLDTASNRDQRLKTVKCLTDKYTDAYPKALKDAAKRVKAAGGYVVAIATSCGSDKFLETLSQMSTGHINLKNFAPEGLVLDSDCSASTMADIESGKKQLAHSIYIMDVDKQDTLFFQPAMAALPSNPLYGTLGDVFAEVTWVVVRDRIGQEVCSNQAEGNCADVKAEPPTP
ncbi:hypothetical protein GC177_01120 [bacterium]|nr:hypothetical protein [bacterium]